MFLIRRTNLAAKLKLAAVILLTALLLCSCGSRLDGTWTSQADPSTKIHFSGSKVRINSGRYKMNGTFEYDPNDERIIIISLTDQNGNLYQINAEVSVSTESDTLTMKNADGEIEVFHK